VLTNQKIRVHVTNAFIEWESTASDR
jgi:hypothetical protein